MSVEEVTSRSGEDRPMLSVDGVEVRYGPLSAVRGVTFEVRAGQVVVLLGANGAGKSSLLKAIVGLERIAGGSAELDGTDISHLSTHRRIGLGMGYLPEGRGVFPNMTVEENILAGLRRLSDRGDVMEQAFELFPVLSQRRKQVAGSMSGGEQQMLSLSRALAGKPRLLLVDELSLGLAPRIVAQLFEKVGELRATGMTIVLVEQFAHAALRVADYAGIFVRGEMTRFAAASELLALSPDELAHLYFGTADESRATNGQAATTKATTEVP
jgi:branched-chain amino acid transport system ATP-binding protein